MSDPFGDTGSGGYGVFVEWYVEAGAPPGLEEMRKRLAMDHLWALVRRHALNTAETHEAGGGKRGRMWVQCEPKVTL